MKSRLLEILFGHGDPLRKLARRGVDTDPLRQPRSTFTTADMNEQVLKQWDPQDGKPCWRCGGTRYIRLETGLHCRRCSLPPVDE